MCFCVTFNIPLIIPFMEGVEQSGPCEPWGLGRGPGRGPGRGYAVLLLEQGVLWVLPTLWPGLLFSEAGRGFWTCCLPAVSPTQGERAGEGVRRGEDQREVECL